MFKSNELKIKKCRLCKSSDLKEVYKFNSSPIGDDYRKKVLKAKRYELKLNMCKRCNFVQLSNVINPKKVYGKYLYVTQTSYGLAKHFLDLTNYLSKKKIIKNGSKVLEIGSNDGTLLKLLKKQCSLLLAVDPAKHLFKDKKIKNIGDHFSLNLSNKIKKSHGKFDVIIANNVLANINDLDDIFKGIQIILNSDGFLVIETFSLYGILKKNLIDNIYHEHLSYFTISSLMRFAKKHHLYLIDVKFLEIKGGSLRFIFQKKYFPKYKKNIIQSIKKEKLVTNSICSRFKFLRKVNDLNKEKLNYFIKKKSEEGKKIVGFGASVGTTTLIYDFELQNKIAILFDNERRRFDLFCPGTAIKVLNPTKLKQNVTDYIIIFAWRYAKIIIEKNKKLFNKDVKFILPLPKFKII